MTARAIYGFDSIKKTKKNVNKQLFTGGLRGENGDKENVYLLEILLKLRFKHWFLEKCIHLSRTRILRSYFTRKNYLWDNYSEP